MQTSIVGILDTDDTVPTKLPILGDMIGVFKSIATHE
jgi:hypothetical protein